MSFQKNIIRSYAAQVVSVISAFLCMVISARLLGSGGQGDLALYSNFNLMAVLLLGFGMPVAIVHFIAAGKYDKARLGSMLLVVVFIGLASIAALVLMLLPFHFFSILLPTFFTLQTAWFVVLFVHLFFSISNALLIAVLQAEHRFSQIGMVQIVGSLLLLCLYAFKYFLSPHNGMEPIYFIILSLLVNVGLQFILFAWQLYRCNKIYFKLSTPALSYFKPLIHFAFIAFATNAIQFLSYRMDIWFLNYYHGREVTGVYALSASFAQMIWLFPSVIQTVLYSFLSGQKDRIASIEKTKKTTWQIAVYAFPAGILSYGLAYFFLPILFGVAFRGAVQSLGILLLGVVPFCLTMGISTYFAASGKVIVNFRSAIIGFVVCLIADLLLIPTYGMIGAAFASVLSYLSTLAYLFIQFKLEREETKNQLLKT